MTAKLSQLFYKPLFLINDLRGSHTLKFLHYELNYRLLSFSEPSIVCSFYIFS